MRNRQGMTLPELLVVIAVVAVIAVLVMPVINASQNRSLDAKCISHLRQVGVALLTYAADHQQTIPTPYNEYEPGTPNRSWATRLVHEGYIGNPDILFCPAFFPRNNAEAKYKPSEYNAQGPQTYGMRLWVSPGSPWTMPEIYKGANRLVTIEFPSDFFLVADSLWTAANWKSQGYGIAPGMTGQYVHLRHDKMANALFADGHVEAKPAEYFKALSDANRQRAYTGNQEREIYTIEKAPF